MKIKVKELTTKRMLITKLTLTEAEQEPSSQSKLKYAMQKWNKLYVLAMEPIDEKRKDVNIDFASEDEKKNIITEADGRYKYSKENAKKLEVAYKDIDNTEIDFEPYLFTDEERISQFESFLVEELRGFFFPSLPTTINEEA